MNDKFANIIFKVFILKRTRLCSIGLHSLNALCRVLINHACSVYRPTVRSGVGPPGLAYVNVARVPAKADSLAFCCCLLSFVASLVDYTIEINENYGS